MPATLDVGMIDVTMSLILRTRPSLSASSRTRTLVWREAKKLHGWQACRHSKYTLSSTVADSNSTSTAMRTGYSVCFISTKDAASRIMPYSLPWPTLLRASSSLHMELFSPITDSHVLVRIAFQIVTRRHVSFTIPNNKASEVTFGPFTPISLFQ